MRSCAFFAFFLFFRATVFSQCCSQGNPINGTTNVGTVDKGNLRVILAHRYNFGDTYFENHTKTDYRLAEESNYNYSSTIISYGLTQKLTLETELGYFINKTLAYKYFIKTNKGFNNAVLSAKYALYKNAESGIEITPALGFKAPFSFERQSQDNVMLPFELQTSTLAYGAVTQLFILKKFKEGKSSLILFNRNELNTETQYSYRYGNNYSFSLFFNSTLNKRLVLVAQTRAEYKAPDIRNTNEEVMNTGGYVVFVSPQISYEIAPKFYFYMFADMPVYRHFYGRQLSAKYGISVSLIKNFCL